MIDLEGCAYEGLRGARKTLEQTAILFVEVEDQAFWTGQRLAVDVKRLLVDGGFVPVGAAYSAKQVLLTRRRLRRCA